MSQSSKCDEHHRLHNAKSPSLIDDTVNTSTHIRWHARTHRLSHTHSRTRTLACKKTKPPLSWHIHPQAEKPPSCHTALLQAQDPRCFVLTHSAYTLISRSPSLSATLSLSHTHALMLQHLLSQRGRRGVKEWGGKGEMTGNAGREREREKMLRNRRKVLLRRTERAFIQRRRR